MLTPDQIARLKKKQYPIQILNRLFPIIGRGSSRIAFKLTETKVLKVAFSWAGIYQNQYEINLYTNNKSSVLNKIYIDECDPDGIYSVHEYCPPIHECSEDLQVQFNDVKKRYYDYSGNSLGELKKRFYKLLRTLKLHASNEIYEFIKELEILAKTIKSPLIYDLHSENVGYKDGKFVIIDYGYYVGMYDIEDYAERLFQTRKPKKEVTKLFDKIYNDYEKSLKKQYKEDKKCYNEILDFRDKIDDNVRELMDCQAKTFKEC